MKLPLRKYDTPRWYWAAHWRPWNEMLWALSFMGMVVVASLAPSYWVVVPVVAVTVVFSLLTSPCYRASLFHDDAMCTWCARGLPEDPGRVAERRKWLLFIYHLEVLLSLIIVVTGLSGAIGVLFCTTRFDDGSVYTPLWVVIAYGVFGFVSAQQAFAESQHRKLRPWCPYCRDWDDEGEHEQVPEPDPRGVKTA